MNIHVTHVCALVCVCVVFCYTFAMPDRDDKGKFKKGFSDPVAPLLKEMSDGVVTLRRGRRSKIIMDRLIPGLIAIINDIGPRRWFERLSATQQYNLIMRAMELEGEAKGLSAAAPPQVMALSQTLVESEKKQMESFIDIEPPIVGTKDYHPAKAATVLSGDSEAKPAAPEKVNGEGTL